MTRHDPVVSMRQMLDHATEARQLVADRDLASLQEDRLRYLAVIHLLEILGEAASRVPPETRRVHDDIPWSEIVGLRNRLIHGYDTINTEILWTILQQDLPRLIHALRAIDDVRRLDS